ncbi:MAG: hypothetical protein ACRCV9_17515 [Burkholderiaceae bacterium]
MSSSAFLPLNVPAQRHLGAERLADGFAVLLSGLNHMRLTRAVRNWLARSAARRRQYDDLAAFWEMAEHDPRVLSDYLAAQARAEDPQSLSSSAPVIHHREHTDLLSLRP